VLAVPLISDHHLNMECDRRYSGHRLRPATGVKGFLMLQSMAGGTGAGWATFLAEALTDEFNTAHMSQLLHLAEAVGRWCALRAGPR